MLEEMLSEEIRDLVRDVIIRLGLYSEDAVELIMLTCVNESHLGKFRYLPRKRTCHGIFQMEINMFNDIVNNYLRFKPHLKERVMEISGIKNFIASDMVNNDKLAVCMVRIHYLRKTEKLPSYLDIDGMANYYKKYYSSTTKNIKEAIINYKRFVL